MNTLTKYFIKYLTEDIKYNTEELKKLGTFKTKIDHHYTIYHNGISTVAEIYDGYYTYIMGVKKLIPFQDTKKALQILDYITERRDR